MITEKDLQEAIAECQGVRNPNANTCIKLAAYYTIMEHIREKEQDKKDDIPPSYSHAPPPDIPTVDYQNDTEFAQMIYGKETQGVISLMDELMTALKVLNPKLYDSVIRKLKG